MVNDNIYERNVRPMDEYKFVLKETADVNINKLIPSPAQSGDMFFINGDVNPGNNDTVQVLFYNTAVETAIAAMVEAFRAK